MLPFLEGIVFDSFEVDAAFFIFSSVSYVKINKFTKKNGFCCKKRHCFLHFFVLGELLRRHEDSLLLARIRIT